MGDKYAAIKACDDARRKDKTMHPAALKAPQA